MLPIINLGSKSVRSMLLQILVYRDVLWWLLCLQSISKNLMNRFSIFSHYLFSVKDGVFRQYKGTRDVNTFVSFIEEKKWQSIEPISSWKAPNSMPYVEFIHLQFIFYCIFVLRMSIVSNFFKISMTLRALHNSLVEDYGIPYWGSYILFAFVTILFGAMLGLVSY